MFSHEVNTGSSDERRRNARGQGERLRTELVEAAAELLSAPGPPPAVPLRAIARQVGVAPSAVYRWFPSGADLLAAVLEHQFADLAAFIEAGDNESLAPEQRVLAACAAYAAWGTAHPGAYRLLFERPDTHDLPVPAGEVLLERLRGLLAAIGAGDSAGRARRLWLAVHGLVLMAIHKSGSWAAALEEDVRHTVRLHVKDARTP